MNSTYIVQCFKDQEPCRSLRFMSRHVDDNGIQKLYIFLLKIALFIFSN